MERKEVLKLRSWEDGKIRSYEDRKLGKLEVMKRGRKLGSWEDGKRREMSNDKCQLNFDISDKKDEVFWTGATFICFMLEDSQ